MGIKLLAYRITLYQYWENKIPKTKKSKKSMNKDYSGHFKNFHQTKFMKEL